MLQKQFRIISIEVLDLISQINYFPVAISTLQLEILL